MPLCLSHEHSGQIVFRKSPALLSGLSGLSGAQEDLDEMPEILCQWSSVLWDLSCDIYGIFMIFMGNNGS